MKIFNIKLGWIIVFTLCLVPLIAWHIFTPIALRFTSLSSIFTSLGQICGLVGLVLFSLAIILSSRLRIFEYLFGGMNQVYIAHHLIGGSAFLFLLVHPIFISISFLEYSLKLVINQIIPANNWPTNFGIAALALLMALLVVTYFMNFRYQNWRLTHKFMGLALFFGALHGFFIDSDITLNPFLRNYFWILTGGALVLYVYRTLLGRYLVKRYKYLVTAVKSINPQTVQVSLSPIHGPMEYLPGQFMFVTFENPKFNETHPFSISSSPKNKEISFTAKNSGDWTGELNKLPLKTKARIEGPFGYFTYSRYENHKQIWIAGGIGITPFYSMANSLQPNYDITLYYAVTSKAEAVYLDEIRKLVNVVPWYSESMGHITAEKIAAQHSPIKAWDIFICGPLPMMTNLKKQFKDLGLKGSQLHTEEFRID